MPSILATTRQSGNVTTMDDNTREMKLRGGGRNRKGRQNPRPPYHRRLPRFARASAPSPTAAREVDYVGGDIQKVSRGRGRKRTADFSFHGGERIVSAPITIDGLIFTELEPLLKILPRGDIGLTHSEEIRMRWDNTQNPPVLVPNLRLSQHDNGPMKSKIISAKEADAYTIRNLKWDESQFRLTGGTLEQFGTYKKNLQHVLEDHYNRLMAHLKYGAPKSQSTFKMGVFGAGGWGVQAGDEPWIGDQLLQLLERK